MIKPGPKVIQHLSCSTHLNMKFILLMTFVGILTFISRGNTSENFKARKIFIFHHFSFYEVKFYAQLS